MDNLLAYLLVGIALGALIGWLAHAAWARRQDLQGGGEGVVDKRDEPTQQELTMSRQLHALEQAMSTLDGKIGTLETNRAASLSSLASQVQAMTRTSTRLSDRTDKLVTALRAPQIRGRWGETQLERVVELGGMVRHCDFDTQVTARLGGQTVRPDLIVHLAGGRQLIVDAKVPFSAYLDAMDTEDPEEHAGFMRRHAHLVRTHITQLADKEYFRAFDPTPEFVIAFVPADPFLDAALEVDPELLEYGFSRNVVLATPTTLFALLRTVALGWQQEDVSDKAREIQRLGRELHERLAVFGEHYTKLGRSLEKAVETYNSTLGSLDSRVLVTARRLAEMELSVRGSRTPTPPDQLSTGVRRSSSFDDSLGGSLGGDFRTLPGSFDNH